MGRRETNANANAIARFRNQLHRTTEQSAHIAMKGKAKKISRKERIDDSVNSLVFSSYFTLRKRKWIKRNKKKKLELRNFLHFSLYLSRYRMNEWLNEPNSKKIKNISLHNTTANNNNKIKISVSWDEREAKNKAR